MGGLSALGLLSGFGQQAHEDNLLKLQQAAQQKEAMMGFYKSIMDNPALEHMAPEAAQAFLHISSTPIDQKWDKSAQKFIKQYDPSMLNQQAIERHASQHPGVQQAQQLQLPPGLMPPPRPGVPGQQMGAADGAAHQTAMNSPGVGAVPGAPQASQPPAPYTPDPAMGPVQYSPDGRTAGQAALGEDPASSIKFDGQQSFTPVVAPPPPQQNPQAVGMLSQTTQMQQGALPSPGPVPQITPSPAQASASAGQQPQHAYTDLLGPTPALPESMAHPHWGRTPAEVEEQKQYQAEMQSRGQRRSALQEQEALDQYKQHQRDTWMARPEVQEAMKAMTPFQRMQFSLPVGMTAPSMAGMTQMMKPVPMGKLIPADAVPDEMRIDKYGNHIDPKKYPHIQGYQDLQTGHMFYEPTEIRAEFTPHEDTNASGGRQFSTFAGAKAGDTPTAIPGAIAPSMLGTARTSSTTTDDNGNSTTSSVSHKVAPGVAPAPGAPPQNLANKPGQPQTGGAGGSAVIQQYADDYSAGKIKLTEIPAKQRNRVLGYMRQNGVQTPDNLSEHGKADMAQLDPVLTQIKDLKGRLEKEGLNGNDNTTALMKDYAMYRLGKDTPHNGLFTNLSFERLRSGAAAMKGTGSRAYQVLSQALDHTPNLDRAGGLLMDTPKAIYDKLVEMEHILTEGRGAILQDERRVGTISPSPGSSNGGSGGSGSGGGGDDAVQRLINKHKGQ